MALRTLRLEGDPILRKTSKEVTEITPRTKILIEDLIECVHEYEGVGLSAVQVGVLKKICVIVIDPSDAAAQAQANEEGKKVSAKDLDPLTHTDGKDIVIINPQISVLDDTVQKGNEGCLSFPGKYGCVTRPNHILLTAQDKDLKPFEMEARGLLARAICHETDHMYGILYVDKVEGEIHKEGE